MKDQMDSGSAEKLSGPLMVPLKYMDMNLMCDNHIQLSRYKDREGRELDLPLDGD